MTAPRFISRVADAVGPVIGLRGGALKDRLDLSVGLRANGDAPAAGFLLAADLLARLYPRIAIDAPPALAQPAVGRVLAINPACDMVDPATAVDAWMTWASEPASADLTVWASGANVALDARLDDFGPADAAAAMVAAGLGVGELFREVFAKELEERGRGGPTPFAFNVVTLGPPRTLPAALDSINLGRMALIGAGAVGQAAVLTLAQSRSQGNVLVVDPEAVELSNLQRYVLTDDTHVDQRKTKLAVDRLRSAGMVTNAANRAWDATMAAASLDAVLVALDSERDRIGVAASLPGVVYNAWTQELDLGWSRHEAFGDEPCLACLHWPTAPRPHQHETIAQEIGQHPLRVLAYLVGRLPAGAPLPPDQIPVTPLIPTPPEAESWTGRSILDDVAAGLGLEAERLARWESRPLTDFHQEAVCAGALLDLDLSSEHAPALVPLAHQSVMAGAMLAVQLLVARHPQLRALRPEAPEARLNVLDNLPQVMPRPRAQTPGCICSDADFLAAARKQAT